MDARSEMLGLLRSRRDGFSLPQPFYNSPDFFRLDLELIWSRDWLFVGHYCEVANPGNFFRSEAPAPLRFTFQSEALADTLSKKPARFVS
jgi:hypothetical protein